MKKECKKFKIFIAGILTSAVVITGVNQYKEKIEEDKNQKITDEFTNDFGIPELPKSTEIEEKKKVKQYTIDYYGQPIVIQDEDLRVYGFDNSGNKILQKCDTVTITVPKDNIIRNDYVSEKEYELFTNIYENNKITNQEDIYNLFYDMKKTCESYISRENFDGKIERINYIYNVCINYIYPGSLYTIGGIKFEELSNLIKEDVLREIEQIKYIKKKDKIKQYSVEEQLKYNFKKIFSYSIGAR